MRKRKSVHYIDNTVFYTAIKEHKEKVIAAQENESTPPRVTEYIGECFMKIAKNLAMRPNFINYTYKDDMISDSIENCMLYINNFDPEKSKNPFAYFTQIIYFAFLRRIQKEKKHTYIKHKLFEASVVHEQIYNKFDASDSYTVQSNIINNDKMNEFITSFEEKMNIKPKTKKVIGLEQFLK